MATYPNEIYPAADLPLATPGTSDSLIYVDESGQRLRRSALNNLPVTAAQRVALDAMQEQVDQLNAGTISESTWARLISVAPGINQPVGSQASIPLVSDPGSHVDPIKDGNQVVPNGGLYVRRTTAANGWEWLQPDTLAAKAEKIDLWNVGMTDFFQSSSDDEVAVFRNAEGARLLAFSAKTGELRALIPASESEIASFSEDALVLTGSALEDLIPTDCAIAADGALTVLQARRKSTGALVGKFEDWDTGPLGASTPDDEDASPQVAGQMAWLSDGAIVGVGGAGGYRVLDDGTGAITWLSVQTTANGAVAAGTMSYGGSYGDVVEMRRVSCIDGQSYPDGEITLIAGLGQSNAGAFAEEGASILYQTYPYQSRLRMLASAADNVWIGHLPSGGDSTAIEPAAITGFSRLHGGQIASAATTPTESAAWAYAAHADAITGGWQPDLLALVHAEGGQFIDNLLNAAPSGFFYASNRDAILTRAADLAGAEGKRIVWRWALMQQGESDPTKANLGVLHDQLRAESELSAHSILGQSAPLRMLSWQMSSFRYQQCQGNLSILARGLAGSGLFFCTGPSYAYPMSAALLHHTSIGHEMMGEVDAVAMRAVDRGEDWVPLHVLGVAVTGANELTLTCSEAVQIDTATVPLASNYGLALVGGDIASVSVAGSSIVIATSAAAASVTAVRVACTGHGATRELSTQARTNFRSAASYGTHRRNSALIYKWLCHQEITL